MISLLESFKTKKKSGHRLASLTAYDYPMGRLLDGLGLDFILVGDSLGMVILGHADTTSVTMDDMQYHTAAVARGVSQTPLIADLPIHALDTPELAVENARQLLRAGAVAVKAEGGREVLPAIQSILSEGMPVMGHLGMLPQRVREEGGYRMKGKLPAQAEEIRLDALALDAAGVFAIVLELVSPPLAIQISKAISAPTIGIGSGPDCDGQILVTHDLLGLFPWFTPGFVKPKVQLADQIENAVSEFVAGIREGSEKPDSEILP